METDDETCCCDCSSNSSTSGSSSGSTSSSNSNASGSNSSNNSSASSPENRKDTRPSIVVVNRSCETPPALESPPVFETPPSPTTLLSAPTTPVHGPRFKLITEGDIQVCYLNHTRTVISKIVSSKFLRRWENHRLYLNDSCISSKTVSFLFLISFLIKPNYFD